MRYEKPDYGMKGKSHRLHESREGLVKESTEHIPELKSPKLTKHF